MSDEPNRSGATKYHRWTLRRVAAVASWANAGARHVAAIVLMAAVLVGTPSFSQRVSSATASNARDSSETSTDSTSVAVPAPAAGVRATEPAPATVPKATCGSNDRPETALQGQVPQVDRVSGRSKEGYWCNLELVGQYPGEGASWQHASFGNCAYYNTANNDGQSHPGTVVVDASDPANPRHTTSLTSMAFLEPWESLKINEARGLLGGVQRRGNHFALYDVRGDCSNPMLLADTHIEGLRGHAGDFAPDGRTYYATHDAPSIPDFGWTAIDTSDPTKPGKWFRYEPQEDHTGYAHDLAVSKDGMRLYVAQPHPAVPNAPGHNGLDIFDVSDIQLRRPNPTVRRVSSLYWTDGSVAQAPLPVTIGGREYIIFTDEMGAGGLTGHASTARACAAGMPPFGFARVIDITDETKPIVVSKVKLEVHDPLNCPSILNDETTWFGYDSHYCSVDNEKNARLLACSYFQSGLRVFDIRDPARPREIAYYNPPARPTAVLQGSSNGVDMPGSAPHVGDRTTDWTSSKPSFRRGGAEIWFTSMDNGFQIIRLTDAALPLPVKER